MYFLETTLVFSFVDIFGMDPIIPTSALEAVQNFEQIDLFQTYSTSFGISALVAFLGGIAAFFSPCTIPVLPGFFAYLSGKSLKVSSRWRILGATFLFVVGFTATFALIGMSSQLILGRFFLEHREIFEKTGGIILFLFGLTLLKIIRLPQWISNGKLQTVHTSILPLQDFLLGTTFGFASIACTGPIWGTILFLATGQQTSSGGAILLIFFSIGLGIPFLISGFFIPELKKILSKMSLIARYSQHIIGYMLIGLGTLFFFGKLDEFLGWIL